MKSDLHLEEFEGEIAVVKASHFFCDGCHLALLIGDDSN
jgi:hypothetical protein